MEDINWNQVRPKLLHAYFGRRREKFHSTRGSFDNWVLIAVEEGSYRYELPLQKGTATFGDLVFCPPEASLGRWMLQHSTHHVIYFDIPSIPARPPYPLYGKYTVGDLPRLSSNYSHLQHLEGYLDEKSMWMKEHILCDIIMLCLGTLAHENATPKISDDLMARAAHYLEAHLHEQISLKKVAESLQLSPVQFTRRFRQATLSTPNEYLISLRLQRARTLLTETDATIDEIARACGYRSGLYLSRLFMKEMNTRPGRFRKQQRL